MWRRLVAASFYVALGLGAWPWIAVAYGRTFITLNGLLLHLSGMTGSRMSAIAGPGACDVMISLVHGACGNRYGCGLQSYFMGFVPTMIVAALWLSGSSKRLKSLACGLALVQVFTLLRLMAICAWHGQMHVSGCPAAAPSAGAEWSLAAARLCHRLAGQVSIGPLVALAIWVCVLEPGLLARIHAYSDGEGGRQGLAAPTPSRTSSHAAAPES